MPLSLTVFGPGHPFRGGIARATTELVLALRERGHAVRFLTPQRQYPAWLYPGGSDRDPEACRAVEGAEAVLDPLAPGSWPQARRRALEPRADAWILPYWTWAWAGLWRFLLAAHRRPPTVAVVHNPADHDARPWQRLAARSVLGRCQGLFSHARVLARELEARYPSLPVGSHPLPAVAAGPAPDRATARADLRLPAEARVALFLGLIRPYKGVDLLVEAAAALPDGSDWLVVAAGEPWGGLGERLERQVEALGVGSRVRLDLRWIPEGEAAALLAAADLVVLPYRRGSQSAVAPMALAAGVPVLTTAVGGVPEVVQDGVNGLIVPPGDPASLAAALEALDPHRLADLAEGARRSSVELSWPAYAAEVEGVVRRLLT
ncbi:MAG TPA: glycosyltransferase family 4 protein [Candidatus Sulfomarinibacteraceae bacterium]|nr:glycosyltransferase family 4 protein [Candidatus Sulfomarinibacteraceae bacterium]